MEKVTLEITKLWKQCLIDAANELNAKNQNSIILENVSETDRKCTIEVKAATVMDLYKLGYEFALRKLDL